MQKISQDQLMNQFPFQLGSAPATFRKEKQARACIPEVKQIFISCYVFVITDNPDARSMKQNDKLCFTRGQLQAYSFPWNYHM